jgi:hypothetical protein
MSEDDSAASSHWRATSAVSKSRNLLGFFILVSEAPSGRTKMALSLQEQVNSIAAPMLADVL